MKMNKKGFTLIELLAIIVILAIIAVITVPIILNIIDNARKGAEKDSIVGYGKAVELSYTQYQYDMQLNGSSALEVDTDANDYEPATDGSEISFVAADSPAVADFTGTLKVTFDGEQVACTSGTIINGKVTLTECTVNDGDVEYVYGNGRACPSDDATDCGISAE